MKDAHDIKTADLLNERVYLEAQLVDAGFASYKRPDGLFNLYRHEHLLAEGLTSKQQWREMQERIKPRPGRGGSRPGSGRKGLDPDGSCVTSIRLTAEQRATFDMLGGGAWLREALQSLIAH